MHAWWTLVLISSLIPATDAARNTACWIPTYRVPVQHSTSLTQFQAKYEGRIRYTRAAASGADEGVGGDAVNNGVVRTWADQEARGWLRIPRAVAPLVERLDREGQPPIRFEEVMKAIDESFHYTPKPFSNGQVQNDAGQNGGSCKLLSMGILLGMDPASTLAFYGEHYRSVIMSPLGQSHPNIRALIKGGWDEVTFPEGLGLSPKQKMT